MQIKIQPYDENPRYVTVDDSGAGGILLEVNDGTDTAAVQLTKLQAEVLKFAIDACLAHDRPI
jgi:hypothetical protein